MYHQFYAQFFCTLTTTQPSGRLACWPRRGFHWPVQRRARQQHCMRRGLLYFHMLFHCLLLFLFFSREHKMCRQGRACFAYEPVLRMRPVHCPGVPFFCLTLAAKPALAARSVAPSFVRLTGSTLVCNSVPPEIIMSKLNRAYTSLQGMKDPPGFAYLVCQRGPSPASPFHTPPPPLCAHASQTLIACLSARASTQTLLTPSPCPCTHLSLGGSATFKLVHTHCIAPIPICTSDSAG